jgi:Icc-related predicted phosphoesterase
MRILAISDLHGELDAAHEAVARYKPTHLVCCGDWGDADQLSEEDLSAFTKRGPVLSTFGNHDSLALLGRLRNQDGSHVLLGQGEVREVEGITVTAIGGIWAKSHRLPHYVTDEDVAAAAARAAGAGNVGLLLTHGCPSGLADLTLSGRHGGQRCFLNAFKAIGPQVHLCGHLHVPQERTLKSGARILNVGATPEGSVAIIDVEDGKLVARLERFPRAKTAG